MSGMGRREFMALLGGAAAWPVAALAQQQLPVIGFLDGFSPRTNADTLVAFRYFSVNGPPQGCAAISRHFERDPIPYALETDWPVGAGGFRTSAFQNRNSPRLSAWAAGFEPLHIEII